MSTTVVEAPVAQPSPSQAHVEVGAERTILRTDEFRCKRPVRVSTGLTPEMNECGAEAFVLVTYPHDLTRYLCAHHATADWDNLVEVAVSIRDERPLINKQASPSANAS